MNQQTQKIKTIPRGSYSNVARKFIQNSEIISKPGTLDHISKIALKFSALPYENLSKILNFYRFGDAEHFRMPDELFEEHQKHRLGGTCFSLTYFLLEILTYTGYDCAPILGDMKWGENVHSAIIVELHNQTFLVDPGYLIHKPLPLSRDTRTRFLTEHSGIEIRFDQESEKYNLYTFRHGNFTWRYRFSEKPVDMSSFSRHWMESFYKPSMHGIVLTKASQKEMIYIHNDFMKITSSEKVRRDESRDTIEKTIAREFGISLDIVEEARMALEVNRSREREIIESS
jgi:arylamine N-acetyltransferase